MAQKVLTKLRIYVAPDGKTKYQKGDTIGDAAFKALPAKDQGYFEDQKKPEAPKDGEAK